MKAIQNAVHELVTLRDFIRFGMTSFNSEGLYYGHGSDNALDEASALVLYALHLPHDLPVHFLDSALTEEEKSDIIDLFERRVNQRIPVPYLTHEAWFAGLRFFVDKRVLIPRSPIAELINSQFEPWLKPDEVDSVLDLCTGSACIAIATAYALPNAVVDASDISDDALAVAEVNIDQHDIADQVQLIKSDLFANLKGKTYDLIVTNPPYVDAEEMASLPEEFRHEPVLGLAAGDDGLDAIITILRQAASHLREDGILIAEVGASEEMLVQTYPEVPFFWFDFEQGGTGVFMLTRDQLVQYFS